MLKAIGVTAIGIGLAFSLFTGCHRRIPPERETTLERNWGTAFESAKYNQILNPKAGEDRALVEGLDARASEKIIEKYRKNFEEVKRQETRPLGSMVSE